MSKTARYNLNNNFALVTGWGVTESGEYNQDLTRRILKYFFQVSTVLNY